MEKRWQKTEIAHLKRHAHDKSLDDLAQRFHTDVDTVRAKLEELGLVSTGPRTSEIDPAIAELEAGLRDLGEKKWQDAATHFEAAIAQADGRQIRDRARQMLAICTRQLATEPEDTDPFIRAVFEKNRGAYDRARELAAKAGDPESDERIVYLLASIDALDERTDAAYSRLEQAIRLEPKNRVHAYHDPDFGALRGRERFRQLIRGA